MSVDLKINIEDIQSQNHKPKNHIGFVLEKRLFGIEKQMDENGEGGKIFYLTASRNFLTDTLIANEKSQIVNDEKAVGYFSRSAYLRIPDVPATFTNRYQFLIDILAKMEFFGEKQEVQRHFRQWINGTYWVFPKYRL